MKIKTITNRLSKNGVIYVELYRESGYYGASYNSSSGIATTYPDGKIVRASRDDFIDFLNENRMFIKNWR